MTDSGTFLLRPVLRFAVLLLAVAFVATGCRTYGGHDSEEATFQQIQVSNQLFEDELQRSRADLRLLARTAEEHGQLEGILDHYQALTIMHEAYLQTHRDKAAQLSPSSRYRDLHRTLGSIVAEQRLVRNQYRNARRNITRMGMPDAEDLPRPVLNRSRYIVVPSAYERMRSREEQQLTMRQALARGLQQPADGLPEVEDPDEAPEEDTSPGAGEEELNS